MARNSRAAGVLWAAVALIGVAGCGGGSGSGDDAGTADATVQCSGTETSCDGTCTDLTTDDDNCGACGASCAPGEACMASACTVVCPGGTMLCGNTCVAAANDPAHCGSCDNACADGEFCVEGACEAACPLTVCGDACVDTDVTSAHCGSCETACDAGQVCVEGACQLACAADALACDGACVDPMTDRAHCGASADCADENAGAACGAGELCVDGTCTLSCGGDLIACDGTCTDPATDRTHCGASADCAGANAGTACGAGELCADGACTLSCPGDQLACGGVCVDPMSDRGFCGASGDCAGANAGTVCADGEVCSAGDCAASCGSALTLCDDSCFDIEHDPMHCGDCTTVCPSGAHALSACDSGTCRIACDAGFGDCDGDATNGCEAVLSDDASNCGACGQVCASGSCGSGMCVGHGHAVLIGHDFFVRQASADRVLGNAVFLSEEPGVLTVLEYTQYSDNGPSGEAANARAAINARATTLGRTLSFVTATSSDAVLTGLATADVFVVYEQESAPDLTSEGMAWATALQDFVARGGVVVVMDYNSSSGGTWRLLAPSGLIVVTGTTDVTGTSLTVDATDPVGAGVTSPYSAPDGSLAFTGVSPADVVTVATTGSAPVVLHRVF